METRKAPRSSASSEAAAREATTQKASGRDAVLGGPLAPGTLIPSRSDFAFFREQGAFVESHSLMVATNGTSRVHARRFVAGALHVLDVRAEIDVRLRLGAAFAAQLEDAVAQAAEELAIV